MIMKQIDFISDNDSLKRSSKHGVTGANPITSCLTNCLHFHNVHDILLEKTKITQWKFLFY